MRMGLKFGEFVCWSDCRWSIHSQLTMNWKYLILSDPDIYYYLGIDRAMEYAQTTMENYPLPDAKGKLSTFVFDVNYAFTK